MIKLFFFYSKVRPFTVKSKVTGELNLLLGAFVVVEPSYCYHRNIEARKGLVDPGMYQTLSELSGNPSITDYRGELVVSYEQGMSGQKSNNSHYPFSSFYPLLVPLPFKDKLHLQLFLVFIIY